ncbi:VanZ family protein [Psychrobacillus psychrodurans]|uniref:VanZ family protein n=1 Tax=Psychrobacillus psychrodurans TaxID=126157 RepID=UPI001F4D94B6|nr:VanZ family protein [Psychrobacillus psychrodurans]MCK1999698.1 VanZ family protein [Psychrobacillus psychrodurans]
MEEKSRKILFVVTILYAILILYFIFFAFNRIDGAIYQITSKVGYTFMIIPEYPPLTFPKLTFGWIYDFGNIAAFIPIGILIPLLYRVSLRKFISLFVLSILFLETMQALTYLGSFDIDDVISNTLGATIGFYAYKVGFSSKITYKKLILSAISICIPLIGIMVISETINYVIEKKESPIQALNELKEITGSMPLTENLPSFTMSGERIEPKMNVYISEGDKEKKYTYILKKKDGNFYANFGIPDNEEFKGEIIIMADGNVRFHNNEEYYTGVDSLSIPFDKVDEITITVSGNAKLWDVGFSEMKHRWN